MKKLLYKLLFKKIVDKELEELGISKEESIQRDNVTLSNIDTNISVLKNKLLSLINIVDNLEIEKLNPELLSHKLNTLKEGL